MITVIFSGPFLKHMRTWHSLPGNLGGMEYLERKYLGEIFHNWFFSFYDLQNEVSHEDLIGVHSKIFTFLRQPLFGGVGKSLNYIKKYLRLPNAPIIGLPQQHVPSVFDNS